MFIYSSESEEDGKKAVAATKGIQSVGHKYTAPLHSDSHDWGGLNSGFIYFFNFGKKCSFSHIMI